VRCKAQFFTAEGECVLSEDQARPGQPPKEPVVIKKYANRRLYNTATSSYVTLDDLSTMVRNGQDFAVYDAKSGEDITRSVLTQIIFEEENKGAQNLLPINFLRQLIRFYGDSMQAMVPGYLEMSLDGLMKEQEKFRKQMVDAMGNMGGAGVGFPPGMPAAGLPTEMIKTMEEQTKRNMAMFQDAMKAFNPFLASMSTGMGVPGAKPAEASKSTEPPKAQGKDQGKADDLQTLKEQITAMQQRLDKMAKN
jgi:polyhydroxyalkanoate synthesis repressor PhaR